MSGGCMFIKEALRDVIVSALFVAGGSASAQAEASGAQHYTARIVVPTCTITVFPGDLDLGDIYKDLLLSDNGPTNGLVLMVRKCPQEVSNVAVKSVFETDSQAPWRVRDSQNGNMYLNTKKGGDSVGWENGVKREFILANGTVSIPFRFKVEADSAGGAVREGSVAWHMLFSLDFS